MSDAPQNTHEWKDGDWAVWSDTLPTENRAALERSWSKGPFQLANIGDGYARIKGTGPLWSLAHFQHSDPPKDLDNG